MTCPRCGAYSPKNTATCNRCGRKLPLLEAGRQNQTEPADKNVLPEHSGYGYGYRQPEQSKFELFLEKAGTFLDENLLESPEGKKLLVFVISVILIMTLIITACVKCANSSEVPAVVTPTDISSSDLSGTDIAGGVSASDAAEQNLSEQTE